MISTFTVRARARVCIVRNQRVLHFAVEIGKKNYVTETRGSLTKSRGSTTPVRLFIPRFGCGASVGTGGDRIERCRIKRTLRRNRIRY